MEKNDYKKIVASCFCSMMLVSSAWAQESDLYHTGKCGICSFRGRADHCRGSGKRSDTEIRCITPAG